MGYFFRDSFKLAFDIPMIRTTDEEEYTLNPYPERQRSLTLKSSTYLGGTGFTLVSKLLRQFAMATRIFSA